VKSISRRQALAGFGGVAAGLGIAGRAAAKPGTVLWRAQAPYGINVLIPAGDVVCMNIGPGLGSPVGTYALDAATGAPAWKSYGGASLVPFAAGPGVVYCADDGAVVAVSSAGGRVIWRCDLDAAINEEITQPGGVYANGTLYTTASPPPFTKGYVIALDSASGRKKWTAPAPTVPTALNVTDGVVYTGWATGDSIGPGVLVALDGATGARRWTSPLPLAPGPLAVTDGAVVGGRGTFSGSNVTFAVDAQTGRELWRTQGLPVTGIAADDGVVYTLSVTLQAIVARTGRQLWSQYSLPDTPGMIALAGGVLYAEAYPSLYAVSAATGKPLWSFRQGNSNGATIAMAAGNGVVYTAVGPIASNSSSTVYAIRM
jgi:outer membrane protein assembly factor BamB